MGINTDFIPAVARLVAFPEHEEHRSRLKSFMAKSREYRTRPTQLLDLQAEMAGTLTGVQQSRKELENQLESTVNEADEKDLRAAIMIAKRLAMVVRSIADGIAWRSLDYDRAMIHQLALKPHTGHIESGTASQEFGVAADYAGRTNDLIVMNDLTNFLRYGDFTSVGPRGIRIHEVKAGAGAAKSGRALRQRKRAERTLEFIRTGQRRTKDGLERLFRFQSRPKSHLGQLPELIRKARLHGQSFERLTDSLAVEILHVPQMADAVADGRLQWRQVGHNPFSQSRDAAVFHSLGFYTKFTPNIAPYSVFPLPVEDYVDTMTGEIWIVSYFNLGNLVRCLRRRGLWAKIPAEQELITLAKRLHGEVRKHDVEYALIASRGRPHPVLLISWAHLGRIFFEFLNDESFAETVEESLDIAHKSNEEALLFAAFANETELWD